MILRTCFRNRLSKHVNILVKRSATYRQYTFWLFAPYFSMSATMSSSTPLWTPGLCRNLWTRTLTCSELTDSRSYIQIVDRSQRYEIFLSSAGSQVSVVWPFDDRLASTQATIQPTVGGTWTFLKKVSAGQYWPSRGLTFLVTSTIETPWLSDWCRRIRASCRHPLTSFRLLVWWFNSIQPEFFDVDPMIAVCQDKYLILAMYVIYSITNSYLAHGQPRGVVRFLFRMSTDVPADTNWTCQWRFKERKGKESFAVFEMLGAIELVDWWSCPIERDAIWNFNAIRPWAHRRLCSTYPDEMTGEVLEFQGYPRLSSFNRH